MMHAITASQNFPPLESRAIAYGSSVSLRGARLELTSPSWGRGTISERSSGPFAGPRRRASCAKAQRRAGGGARSKRCATSNRLSVRPSSSPPPGLLRACALRRPTSPQGGGNLERARVLHSICDSPPPESRAIAYGSSVSIRSASLELTSPLWGGRSRRSAQARRRTGWGARSKRCATSNRLSARPSSGSFHRTQLRT